MMGSHTGRCRFWWAVPAVLLLGSGPGGAAPPAGPPIPVREDTHLFRRILQANGFQPLHHGGELLDAPERTLFVVLGDTACLGINGEGWLREFLNEGGAVLIASDRVAPTGQVFAAIRSASGVALTSDVFLPPPHPGMLYRGRPDCPFLQPVGGRRLALLGDPTRNNDPPLQVVVSAPARLEPLKGGPASVVPVAILPRLLRGPEWLFAVGGDVGKGRILVLASPSVFSNEMIHSRADDPQPRQNAEFAARCVRWLAGGRRDRVLLFNEGVVQDDFTIPITLKNVPAPPLTEQQLVALADAGLHELEEQNAFNHGILQWLAEHNTPPQRLARWAVIALAVLALGYGVYRVGVKGRHKLDTNLPLLGAAVGGHIPQAVLLEQRAHTLHKTGNLWEVARELARQWFAAAGAEPAVAGAPGPRVKVRGAWWHRWGVGRRVRRLWRLAYAAAAVRVSAAGLERLRAELAELEEARAQGDLLLTN
jgi:hypothetical protein